MKTINGVTLKEITNAMNNIEKVINWYNKKYSFDISKATTKEQKEYNSLLQRWDFLKIKRDSLNI